jgi:23S rRNA (uracil1939-C5)-methyltransferase
MNTSRDEPGVSQQVVELTIEDLAFDGKSVAHLDGKVVFLNAGLPGETVRAEITRIRPRYCQATVLEIVSKAASRVPALCSHFDQCGGCTWQDLDYQEQLRYKKQQVVESISRIGGLEGVTVQDVIPSAELFGYRNKMEYSFHTTPAGGFTLGLHSRGRFDEIFDLDTCHLQATVASRIVDHVRSFVTTHGLPVYDVLQHRGYVRFLVIRNTKRTGQLMVNLVTNYGQLPERDAFVRELMTAFPEVTTIVHCENGQKSNIATAEREAVLSGPGFIEEQLLGLTSASAPARSFRPIHCRRRRSTGRFRAPRTAGGRHHVGPVLRDGYDRAPAGGTSQIGDRCRTGSRCRRARQRKRRPQRRRQR